MDIVFRVRPIVGTTQWWTRMGTDLMVERRVPIVVMGTEPWWHDDQWTLVQNTRRAWRKGKWSNQGWSESSVRAKSSQSKKRGLRNAFFRLGKTTIQHWTSLFCSLHLFSRALRLRFRFFHGITVSVSSGTNTKVFRKELVYYK
jgi:hypothetical protein